MNRLKTIFRALSGKERITFLVAASIFVVSILVLAGRFIYQNSNLVPTRGGEYVEGFVGQPAYVNPVLASGDVDRSLTRLLFANIPALADSIDTSKDGKTWTVRLKPNLVWHDPSDPGSNHKLTSDDVIFTIARIQDAETNSPLAAGWQGISALRVSELEVQISLVTPYAFFGDTLAGLYPIPKYVFGNIPVSNWRLSDFNLKPVGSGAYAFDGYDKQANGFINQYRMKPNDKYGAGAPAFIEHLRFDFFGDGTSLLGAFNTGAVDGITSPDMETLRTVKRSYRSDLWSIPSYYAVFFNQSQNIPLKDLVVRQALGMSIDRGGLVKAVFDGNALPAVSPIPPGSGKATASSTAFDSAGAAKLLDDAGWKLRADGVREKTVKDGKVPLALTLTVPQIPFLTKTADLLKNAWQTVGVQVTVVPLPTGNTMTETIKNRDYQALLFGNVLGPSLDLYPFWHSKERFAPGLNLSLYSNKKVDALIEAMEHNADVTVRAGNLTDAEQLIVLDVPAVFLYSPYYVSLVSKDIHGIEPHLVTEPADRFLDLGKWYVKTTRAVQ